MVRYMRKCLECMPNPYLEFTINKPIKTVLLPTPVHRPPKAAELELCWEAVVVQCHSRGMSKPLLSSNGKRPLRAKKDETMPPQTCNTLNPKGDNLHTKIMLRNQRVVNRRTKVQRADNIHARAQTQPTNPSGVFMISVEKKRTGTSRGLLTMI